MSMDSFETGFNHRIFNQYLPVLGGAVAGNPYADEVAYGRVPGVRRYFADPHFGRGMLDESEFTSIGAANRAFFLSPGRPLDITYLLEVIMPAEPIALAAQVSLTGPGRWEKVLQFVQQEQAIRQFFGDHPDVPGTGYEPEPGELSHVSGTDHYRQYGGGLASLSEIVAMQSILERAQPIDPAAYQEQQSKPSF